MRLHLVFIFSFSVMVGASLYEGRGPVISERSRYGKFDPYVDYRPQVQNDEDYIQELYEENDKTIKPEFTYRINDDDEPVYDNNNPPFAVPPSNILYYRNYEPKPRENRDKDAVEKRLYMYEMQPHAYDDNVFSDRRTQRQNPNVAPNKFHKTLTSTEKPSGPVIEKLHPFGSIKDIPTSLVPASIRHNALLREALKNHQFNDSNNEAMNIYLYAMVASVIAAVCVIVAAFGFGWYTIQKKMKAAADAEYPAYGVTGPNTNTSPSGDRRLAHSAQLYHYQHQKQQILAMEKNINERNGSVSDPESEDENEEGDYTVYECPGFATTGELEVKNPLFLDEPTPATPPIVIKGAEK